MRMAVKTLAVLFTTAILAVAQSTPDQPDPLALLNNVELTYKAMTSYSAKSTNVVSVSMLGMQQKIEVTTNTTMDSSGKMRIETTGMPAMLMVFDGDTLWMYMTQLNKYAKISAGTLGASGAEGAKAAMPGLGGDAMGPYITLTSNVKNATIVRSEKVPFNGSDVDCWVVSVEYAPATVPAAATGGQAPAPDLSTKTLWIDKTHYLVYREDSTSKKTVPGFSGQTESSQTVKYESILVDPPIAPDTFTFTPPPGATEMDLSSFMPKPTAPK